MMIASEAAARSTLVSVIAPTPRSMTRRLTSSPTSILRQRVLEGLDRTGHVALEDEVELLALALLHGGHEVLEGTAHAALGLHGRPLARLALLGDLAGHPVVLDHDEVLARAGHARSDRAPSPDATGRPPRCCRRARRASRGPGRRPDRRRSSRRRAACRAGPAPWRPDRDRGRGAPRPRGPGRPGPGWPAGPATRRRSARPPRAACRG